MGTKSVIGDKVEDQFYNFTLLFSKEKEKDGARDM